MKEYEPSSRNLRADAVLVGVTIVWGSSFVVVKNVYEESPPLQFLFCRFLFATLLVAGFLFARRRSPLLWRDGLILGLLLAGGIALQVLGIPDTTASNAAFLTGLSVVLTPFVAYLRTQKLPSLENTVGITLAGLGFALLTFPSRGSSVNRGDVLLFLCGIVFAFYIVELAERSGRHDAVWLTAIQLATVVLLAAGLILLLRLPLFSEWTIAVRETRPVVWRGGFLWGVLYLGSIGTVGTFFGQTWAQRHMSATHAAIIFALEPVVAALLAAWFLGERLGLRGNLGGLLVIAGIVAAELKLRGSPRPDQSSGNVSV
jgi:drug/metabolite transporter (DMT)-like permease